MKSLLWFVPAIFVFLGILLLSTVFSIPIQAEGVGYLDKIEHAFAYFVLVISLLVGFYKSGHFNTKVWVLIFIFASCYGVALEWVQFQFFPNRYFEWLDALANVSGAIIGSIAFRIVSNG